MVVGIARLPVLCPWHTDSYYWLATLLVSLCYPRCPAAASYNAYGALFPGEMEGKTDSTTMEWGKFRGLWKFRGKYVSERHSCTPSFLHRQEGNLTFSKAGLGKGWVIQDILHITNKETFIVCIVSNGTGL